MHRITTRLLGCALTLLAIASTSQSQPPIDTLRTIFFQGSGEDNHLGNPAREAGDLNGDGIDDFVIAEQENGSTARGSVYIYFGGPGLDNTPDLTLTGEEDGDRFGHGVAGAGDVNHDGFDDLLVGAIQPGGAGNGLAYVFLGGSNMNATPDLSLEGEGFDDFFGYEVSSAGDVNEDGFADFMVSAVLNDAGGDNAGRVYLYHGGSILDDIPDLVFTGSPGDMLGGSLGPCGDVNADSHVDVLIGTCLADAEQGRVYLFLGGPGMDNTPDLVFHGQAPGDRFGYFRGISSTPGDINGDGYCDVVAPAPWSGPEDMCRIYVFYGGPGLDNIADVTLFTETGIPWEGHASVSIGGDINNDGFSDIVVGMSVSPDGGYWAGKAYVFLGGTTTDTIPDKVFIGGAAGDFFGTSVAIVGDPNSDGFDDILVSAYEASQYPPAPGYARLYLMRTIMLANPGFESGTGPWVFYTNATGLFASEPPGYDSPRSGHVTISTPGTNVQLYQRGVTLEPRTRYRLKFAAYSTTGHDLKTSVVKNTAPFTNYGLNWTVNLTNSWQEYSTEFTTTGFSAIVDDARLRFVFNGFAAAGDHYHIDNVIVEKVGNTLPVITSQPEDKTVSRFQTATFAVTAIGGAPLSYQWQKDNVNITSATDASYTTPPVVHADNGSRYRCIVTNPYGAAQSTSATLYVVPAASVVSNSGFESGTDNWSFYSNGEGSFSIYPHHNKNGESCAKMSIGTAGTNVQLSQSGLSLEPGTIYTLTFQAYSTTGHNMAVYLQKNTAPYTNFGVNNWVVDLTGDWQSFARTFRTAGFSSATSDARLRFWFAPYDAAGDQFFIDDVWFVKTGPGKEPAPVDLPAAFALHQNYPNPFNPVTNFQFSIVNRQLAVLKVYNLLGQEVATLVNEILDPGYKSVEWDASGFASGVYLYRLQSGTFVDTKKLVVLK